MLVLEVFRQLVIIEVKFCGGKNKKGFFKCPLSFGIVIMVKKQTHGLLEELIAHLGMVLVCEKWDYNPDNDLVELNIKVTHSSWPYWEARRNLQSGDPNDLFVDLAYVLIDDRRPPWLTFYFSLENPSDKCKIGATLHN